MSDAFYTKTWFWLLAVTTIALIVLAILFEYYGASIDQVNGIPFWVWLGFAVAIIAYLASVILYIIDIRKITYVTVIEKEGGNTIEKTSNFVGSDDKPLTPGITRIYRTEQ